jgi:glycosyltransferase involved in cell wall biosynthesis
MISAIVPSYKNPDSLNICLRSFIDNVSLNTSELICIIDGHSDIYDNIIKYYKQYNNIYFIINSDNQGMSFSINTGAAYANNSWLLVLNDDNVFPKNWDGILSQYKYENFVISPNQIERKASIFNFVEYDFGDVDHFRYDEFIEKEPQFRIDTNNKLTNDGEIFPFMISKKIFMACGGFDITYPSPFICDWDFFLKLELLGIQFARTRELNFYHFGSVYKKL